MFSFLALDLVHVVGNLWPYTHTHPSWLNRLLKIGRYQLRNQLKKVCADGHVISTAIDCGDMMNGRWTVVSSCQFTLYLPENDCNTQTKSISGSSNNMFGINSRLINMRVHSTQNETLRSMTFQCIYSHHEWSNTYSLTHTYAHIDEMSKCFYIFSFISKTTCYYWLRMPSSEYSVSLQ